MTPEYEILALLRAYDYGTLPFNEDSRAVDLFEELQPLILEQAYADALELFKTRVEVMKDAALELYQNADSKEMITEYLDELLEVDE